jgi:hypothetical protein
VDDDVAVVEQHPVPLVTALDPQGLVVPRVRHLPLDLVDDGAHLPVVGRRGHHELVGDHEDLAHLHDEHVLASLVVRGPGRRDSELPGLVTCLLCLSQLSSPS